MLRFRWTIKRKLLALGAGMVLPLLLLLAFWVWWEVREHTEAAEEELTLVSQQAARHVWMLLEQVMASFLGCGPSRRTGHREEARLVRSLSPEPASNSASWSCPRAPGSG